MEISCRSLQSRKASRLNGFSLVEIVLAIAIGSLALAGTIAAFDSNLIAGKRAADRNTIEETIARDIGWIRNYAKVWKMQSGPYELSNTQTYTSSPFTTSPYISYSPNSGGASCSSGLASSFLSNAETVGGLSPDRPFSLLSSEIPLSRPIPGLTLSRTISYANPNSYFTITYGIAGGTLASELGITRQTAIYIEAAAWCAS